MPEPPLLLNFLPVRKGGGLQNALSFIGSLRGAPQAVAGKLALVRRGSDIDHACAAAGIAAISVKDSAPGRLLFELGCRARFPGGQVCFTIFGPPPVGAGGHLLNVVGCAYSNLFYPEIDFWGHLNALGQAKCRLVDRIRESQTQQADYWIFETQALRRRAVDLCGFPELRTAVVRMAPSGLVGPSLVRVDVRDRTHRALPPGFRFLILSGAHPNKRLHLLPDIAAALRERGCRTFLFVLTVDPVHPYGARVLAEMGRRGLAGHVHNLGPVLPADVASVIDACDAICTFSLLESFSNNFVEAWTMAKPLVATDADWARDSCGEAALYVPPDDAAATAEALARLIDEMPMRDTLRRMGTRMLGTYHTPESKRDAYFAHAAEAERLGPCTDGERRRIRWPVREGRTERVA